MMTTRKCLICDAELNEENWYPSDRKRNCNRCKGCTNERNRLWVKANPEKAKDIQTRSERRQGKRPFNENKECAVFLGVHVAEQVLSRVFKDVEIMPFGNPGYDFICKSGKRIDVKSSCLQKNHKKTTWFFNIKKNKIADFFLCLAFDNREDLNPLHAWLIPGSKLNNLVSTSISPSRIHKWDTYKLDISKMAACCDIIRGV